MANRKAGVMMLALVVVVVLVAAFYYMSQQNTAGNPTSGSGAGSGSNGGSASNVGSSSAPAPTPKFACDQNALNAAYQYYYTKGPFAGVFGWTNQRINPTPVGPNQCDVTYTYVPVAGSSRTDTGTDSRRFTFDSSGNVTTIGDYHSGTTLL